MRISDWSSDVCSSDLRLMITRTFAFAALLMALSACGENAPAKHETPPPTVTIDTVVRRPLPNGLSASGRSEEHTSELQSLMRISYAVFCLKKKKTHRHRYKNE